MIGKNIYQLRKRKGLTLSELAERAGISKSYLSNIERELNQNPSLKVMKKIAFVLNVDLTFLLIAGDYNEQSLDREWIEFVKELKASGIEKEQIKDYQTLIEFIQWQKRKDVTQ